MNYQVRPMLDPWTGRMVFVRPRSMVGATIPPPPTPASPESFMADLAKGLKGVTPSLLIIGITAGAAFAIGSGLVGRYLFRGKR